MERDPQSLNFTVVALAKAQSQQRSQCVKVFSLVKALGAISQMFIVYRLTTGDQDIYIPTATYACACAQKLTLQSFETIRNHPKSFPLKQKMHTLYTMDFFRRFINLCEAVFQSFFMYFKMHVMNDDILQNPSLYFYT